MFYCDRCEINSDSNWIKIWGCVYICMWSYNHHERVGNLKGNYAPHSFWQNFTLSNFDIATLHIVFFFLANFCTYDFNVLGLINDWIETNFSHKFSSIIEMLGLHLDIFPFVLRPWMIVNNDLEVLASNAASWNSIPNAFVIPILSHPFTIMLFISFTFIHTTCN